MAKRKGFSFAELSFMPVEFILKNLPFLVFLGFLAVIYIANSHYAERNVRKIQVLQKDLKELRWFYMSLQSENMVNSMQSEVVDKVADDGLRLQRGQVKKIVVSK
ncbi:MAG: hypothetical protein DWQ02_20270 [Bacteroidetes bacterium]|nr:MAG: hypothetical protein DWQ02_20270 [Bacteroidota bacterium]